MKKKAESLGTRPRISKNSRRGAPPTTRLISSGVPLCIAGFEMPSHGIWWNKAKTESVISLYAPKKAQRNLLKNIHIAPSFIPDF